jgi:hypothetical protein
VSPNSLPKTMSSLGLVLIFTFCLGWWDLLWLQDPKLTLALVQAWARLRLAGALLRE